VDLALRMLIDRATERDPDAWEAIYRRSYGPLFGFARRRLYDDQAAEDAVSETMARALDGIDRFRWQGGGFDAWLFGIVRNVVREHTRARWRNAGAVGDERVAPERGPEEHAVAGDDLACVRHAFARLSEEDREVLELRVQGGLSSEEVGRILGKRPGAIRMAQARALQRLRVELEEVRGVQ
jgi:RNA polymerase sigma-70 factor (ECF subfamily)